ncbi:hypothetical protein KUTeg_012236 [Tegillarca granosa]|uniref:Sodium/hydrogen exchanger n=1 Tax=Tegillarca granosa TaxID=220873 RepID=A0ABQ9EYY6_TEGGR|nr:hypothetical protein KUTeg_012236 [Tegillarca granosa]
MLLQGTILNCFLIGPTLYALKVMGAMGEIDLNFIQCLVFSAVIVAVDPVAVLAIFQEIGVNNVLYFLVFGESLLNDAVTVVLYNMMIEFNKMPQIPVEQIFLGIAAFFVVSLGGLTIGVLFGILTAIITKYTKHVRVVEPLTVFVLAYISYLTAELFHFSGIISIIGCGLTQAQYAFHNISAKSRTTITYFSKMQSATSDCIIFMFLGIALFKSDMFKVENWHAGLILWTLFLCLLYRFIVVFALTYVMNKFNRLRKIDAEEQFIMAYGGLRGAVAFSLVDTLDDSHGLPKNIFLSTTLSVIFFTVFVQGISIKPLTKLLRVKLQDEKILSITEEINSHVTDHVMAGIEELLGEHGQHYVREKFEFYNNKYIRNWLQRDPVGIDEQIMSMFEEISLQQHFENLAGSKMIQDKYGSAEALLITSTIPEEDYEEEEGSGSEHGSQELVLPSVTVPVPTVNFIMPDLHDQEIDNIRARFGKKRDSREALENPTAKDIRKLMIPTRRELQHKKLDKNLKDESQADLLKYLQDKQFRTRRMSRAVLLKESSLQSPDTSNSSLNSPQMPRRQSLDATAAVTNYRRRLSLALPEKSHQHQHRIRLKSDVSELHRPKSPGDRIGDASQSPDRPHRRKKPAFKKGLSLGCEPISEQQELSPLIKDKYSPSSPTSPSIKPSFEVIHENEELDSRLNRSFDSDRFSKK